MCYLQNPPFTRYGGVRLADLQNSLQHKMWNARRDFFWGGRWMYGRWRVWMSSPSDLVPSFNASQLEGWIFSQIWSSLHPIYLLPINATESGEPNHTKYGTLTHPPQWYMVCFCQRIIVLWITIETTCMIEFQFFKWPKIGTVKSKK